MDKIIKTSLFNTLATTFVDDLGRVKIPKAVRQETGLVYGQKIFLFLRIMNLLIFGINKEAINK